MNRKFIGRMAAAALLATLIPVSERANAQTINASFDETLEVSATDQSLESPSADTLQTSLRSATAVRVNAHAYESRQAATVYVRDIPVLTYVDQADTAEITSGWLSLEADMAAGTDAITSAAKMAVKLQEMKGNEVDITAQWEAGSYVVMAGETPLVTLGETIQLPDATDNQAEDVLQVTNRLRRLLGDGAVEPVTEVLGRPEPQPQQVAAVRSSYSGIASWYGPGFHGRTSASGESFNQYAMTAAHRTLPFGTQVRVTNLNNGRQVVVRINDRGPYSGGRIIDLSAGAADAIGLQSAGVGPVKVEVLR